MQFILIIFLSSLSLFAREISVKEQVQLFRQKKHMNEPALSDNPYEKPLPKAKANAVCAIHFEDDKIGYHTKTYADKTSAEKKHGIVTHMGPCGTCSSLQDLAVYLEKPDLTKPGKKCAMLSWLKSASVLCFKRIGFSEPCAETWYYNAKNTVKECFWTCIGSFLRFQPSNLDDGSLNACLKCDEEKSGPVFKQVAGRTRRNSGINSSIGRSEAEIAPIIHNY